MKGLWGRHLLGVGLSALVGLVVAIVYILLVPKEGLDGWSGIGLTLSVVLFPLVAMGFTAFLWTPLAMWWHRRRGPMSSGIALALGLGVGLLIATLVGGPSGFTTRGSTPLINVALVLVFGGAAVVNAWFLQRYLEREGADSSSD
ncbi:MAG: hypothetical protein RhofKO_37380 [Rhodothermales bacterium]